MSCIIQNLRMTKRNKYRPINDEEFRALPITIEGKLISIDYLVSKYKKIEENNKKLVKLNNKLFELQVDIATIKYEIEEIRELADSLRVFHRDKYHNITD